jgi:sulfite exporter TauE/SafE/copper chaperone CopZ
MMKQQTYAVAGMHCASCEAIIERRVRSLECVSDIRASISDGQVTISFEGEPPAPETLTGLFPQGLYTFSPAGSGKPGMLESIRVLGYAAAVVTLFFGLSASGLLPPLSIGSSSSYGAFFLFGLTAGMSTCAALVGGLVLALSTQWLSRIDKSTTITDKLKPQLFFNTGRIAAYAAVGALLGLLGGSVRISPGITSVMVVAVSMLMIVLALQMLGFSPFRKLRTALPKKMVLGASRGFSKRGMLLPFPSGIMTILLPCGFTLAAESAAILSGSPWQGMAIMTFFVLGTLPPLLAIGLSSSELARRPGTSRLFTKTAGLLVMFLTLYNLNSQFGIAALIAGKPSVQSTTPAAANAASGKEVRTIYTNAADIVPANFVLKRGEKVRFVVDSRDTASGCMSTIMVPGLWNRPEDLVRGKTIVMEFTPIKPGNYQITCAMGVPRGTITVK